MRSRELILIVAGLASLFVFLVVLVIRLIIDRSQAHMHRRLNGHDETEIPGILARRAREKKAKGWAARMDRRFEEMIQRTGTQMTAQEALALIALLTAGLAVGFYLIREELWLALFGMALGMGVPLGIFYYLQARYRRQLQDQLPDAFYLLARSMRAGLTLPQAIELVGEHGSKPLAGEFHRCSGQIRLGLPVREALQTMADRVQLLDFNAFVSTVILHQQTGGNLAEQLDRLAAGTRDRNQYRGYFRSATALGRITSTALALGVPLILLYYALFQPEHAMPFFQSTVGWIVVSVALGLELVGAVWMYFLLRVEL